MAELDAAIAMLSDGDKAAALQRRRVHAPVALLAVGIVGCGPGYEKGVNKDLDKPVPADQQPEKK